ncbi:MAG: hypothetical protein M3N31_01505 [Actinomycetota bacterium]|nr:hypothetical protein [Actinomycetota bacterium]
MLLAAVLGVAVLGVATPVRGNTLPTLGDVLALLPNSAPFNATPLSGGPGTVIRVSGVCGFPKDVADLGVSLIGEPEVVVTLGTSPPVIATLPIIDDEGNWAGTLTVPSTATPGTYPLNAVCNFSGEVEVELLNGLSVESAWTESQGVRAATHEVGHLGDVTDLTVIRYQPRTFEVVVPAQTAQLPSFGDLGAAVPVDAVPRFTG